jgi:hypothetical protein
MQRVVGSSLRSVSSCCNLSPLIVDDVVGPEIIEIFTIFGAAAIASQHYNFSWTDSYEAVAPSFLGHCFVLAAVGDWLP